MNDRPSKTRGEVDKQLAFALYGAATRMARMHKPFLEPLGLTFPQYLAMLELLDGAPLSVGGLGARLGMDTGTITPLVKRLEAAGLVARARSPHDEREVRVSLTDEGAEVVGRTACLAEALLAKSGMGLGELAQLRDLVRNFRMKVAA